MFTHGEIWALGSPLPPEAPEPCQESNKGNSKKALNSTDPGMQGLAIAEGSDSL